MSSVENVAHDETFSKLEREISLFKEGDFIFVYKQRRNIVTAKSEICKIIQNICKFRGNIALQSGSLPPK